MTGTQLLYTVMERIMREPETYNQEQVQCGTAFCVAGHIGQILNIPMRDFQRTTGKLLGMSGFNLYCLISAVAVDRMAGGGYTTDQIGTPAYALLGARHILAFIRQHQAHLDTWIVPGTDDKQLGR